MAACHELGDVRRAVAWTRATKEWLQTLPAAVLFTGICRVHRSQVLQATGGWEEAEAEAARVCEDLEHIHVASAAEAHYQVAELCRLRGFFDDAEDAYEQARARGRDPQPGLALLHLARGRPKLAASALEASLAGTDDPLRRLPLRAAQVEIALQAGDFELAGQACDEVAAIADRFGCDGFVATSQTSRAACLLASGQAEPALALLRTACRTWRELGLPYDAARAGVLLARACAAAGDRDGAARELEAARKLFDRLGAVGDVKIVDGLRGHTRSDVGLTAREIEVLAEVAAGRTNRQIADRFVISERTVERHLSNIFVKLDCGSRTAAAAYAHEQGLVPRAE
nr:helix-turn-helix transcriptional regulator [Phytoactinopolyspora mesophila]